MNLTTSSYVEVDLKSVDSAVVFSAAKDASDAAFCADGVTPSRAAAATVINQRRIMRALYRKTAPLDSLRPRRYRDCVGHVSAFGCGRRSASRDRGGHPDRDRRRRARA